MDGGVYIAVFHLPAGRTIRVGRLGRFEFAGGWYVYIGSAQRHLAARLARHARRKKPLRWHVDYLARHAPMVGAITIDGDKSRECALAAEMAERLARAVPRFGASDCRCGGHLFHTADSTSW